VRLVLASVSPRRKELLARLGLPFVAVDSGVAEKILPGEKPEEVVRRLAWEKALAALNADQGLGPALFLACDTVVCHGERILGKPRDQEEARKMLQSLSGRWHQVYTGLSLVHSASGQEAGAVEITRVHFRELENLEIEAYLTSGEPMDKAGAYGIQGLGAVLADRIEGCYYNVVGLPLSRLTTLFKEFGIQVLGGNN